jgi:Flp pilus assembly protein TadB
MRRLQRRPGGRLGIRHSRCCREALVRKRAAKSSGRENNMLETIAIILIVLWLLGMVSGYTLGNFIYVLLVIAIVLFLVRVISGRRV